MCGTLWGYCCLTRSPDDVLCQAWHDHYPESDIIAKFVNICLDEVKPPLLGGYSI